MIVYNLFPLLAGPFAHWPEHFQRAADLGCDWVYVNPIQLPGASGSLYAIADPYRYHPLLLDAAGGAPEEQVRRMIAAAHARGLRLMIDLVISHCAYDAPLTRQHPEWFRQEHGRPAHPSCRHGTETVVWTDLAQFDHRHSRDRVGLYAYCRRVAEHLLDLGCDGFRCDAAYQLPGELWRRLSADLKARRPDAVLVAETLGCTAEQTKATAQAGFDYIFNSAKYWDFRAPWLVEQYALTCDLAPSIAFPESHDTARLAAELDGNVAGLKQRYLFTALFSSGVLLPIGFEFGFRRRLDVVRTRPADWETTGVDLRPFIAAVNRVKRAVPAFHEEGPLSVLPCANPDILLLWRAARHGRGGALLILNTDVRRHQEFATDRFHRYLQTGAPLRDVSPEYALDYLPEPFHYALRPGQGLVLTTTRPGGR